MIMNKIWYPSDDLVYKYMQIKKNVKLITFS